MKLPVLDNHLFSWLCVELICVWDLYSTRMQLVEWVDRPPKFFRSCCYYLYYLSVRSACTILACSGSGFIYARRHNWRKWSVELWLFWTTKSVGPIGGPSSTRVNECLKVTRPCVILWQAKSFVNHTPPRKTSLLCLWWLGRGIFDHQYGSEGGHPKQAFI